MFSSYLIERLKSAQKIAVLTGAGISAESGVPTFRGEQGLWKKYRPEELANFDAFMRNPDLVWEWYMFRRELIEAVLPNPGHRALARLESFFPDFTLITQNVDGLHHKAGSRRILELHGNIMRSRCVDCGVESMTAGMNTPGELPICSCGGRMRPDVVWFGEMLPADVLYRASEAARSCDVFFSIGTSAIVQPAASLPLAAKEAGAAVVEINVEPTVISGSVDFSILGKSGEVLPKLLKEAFDIDL